MIFNLMDKSRPDESPTAATRADMYRERFRRTQVIAAQAARARAAGGTPSEDEAARLVAEYQARGGRVTVYPLAEDDSPDGSTSR
ncbi:hypothetical protein GCM10011504_48930 [Siccirubricoccus deserti]|nr:hypothetical protein GCM10011504_48930 [Siccirubricoccus deserti]